MNNNQLTQISGEIDTFFVDLLSNNKLSALNLTAIILARLAALCDDLQCRDDLNELLIEVAQINIRSTKSTLQ